MLSDKIKKIRILLNMNQREFAKEVGCAQSVIANYESGIKKPSYDKLVIIQKMSDKNKLKVKLLGED